MDGMNTTAGSAGVGTTAKEALESSLDRVLAGSASRYLILILHTLVTIVLSYQLVFTAASLLSAVPRELIVSGLLGSTLILAALPDRAWATKWLAGGLVIIDTLATSLILYLSGNASSNLYLTYFLIMLLAAFAPSLKQMTALAFLLCAAHGATLYLELGQSGMLEEGRLLTIPVLFILAMFYGVTTESARKLSRDKADLLLHIKERKRAEEENLRAQAFITSIVENLPNMLFVKDAENLAFVRLNKAGEDLLGYPRQELIGKTNHDCFPKEEADLFSAQDRSVLDERYLLDIPEEVIRTKHKGTRTLHTKKIPILDEQGNARYLLGISEDVTERRRAEEALRVKTEQLQAISECMTQFLEDGDWGRASSYLLRSALKQTGSEYGFIGVLKEGQALQVLASGALSPEGNLRSLARKVGHKRGTTGEGEVVHLESMLGEVITNGRVVLSNDCRGTSPSGNLPSNLPPPRHILGVPILHGPEVVGIIGVANRLGGYTGEERGRLEILMQAAGVLYDSYRRQVRESDLENRLVLSQKLEAVGRLAGGIAHDFNNLLTIIVGYCHVLLKRMDQADPLRKGIGEIRRAGEHASSLTQQLLAFSRRQVLKPKILNLNAVVSELAPMLLPVIGEQIHVVTKLDPKLGNVEADPGQIQQVLMNLLINARDAMPDEGQLTIETANVDFSTAYKRGQVELSGRFASLSVTDTGLGMDKETQSHVFEPFFTTKAQGEGTGLGLATSYGIIKQSGGFIFVDSEPEEGTTFKIYLPRVDAAAQAEELEKPEAVTVGGTETVLLVEDQPGVRALLRQALEQSGYTVLEAENGSEALEVSKQHAGAIDLLLTDLVMPKMGGPEVATQLSRERPTIKVLYMTGYSRDAMARRKIASGTDHLLQKPFTPDVLVRTVRQVLDGDLSASVGPSPVGY